MIKESISKALDDIFSQDKLKQPTNYTMNDD